MITEKADSSKVHQILHIRVPQKKISQTIVITQVTSSDAKHFVHKQAPENLNIRRTEEKIINLQNQRVRPGTPTCVNIKSAGSIATSL